MNLSETHTHTRTHLREEWGQHEQWSKRHHDARVEVVGVEEERSVGDEHEQCGGDVERQQVEAVAPHEANLHHQGGKLFIGKRPHGEVAFEGQNKLELLGKAWRV